MKVIKNLLVRVMCSRMWTSAVLPLLCVSLLIGVNSSILPANADDDFEVSLPLLNENVLGCYLDTPDRKTIEFLPTDHSDDATYQLVNRDNASCAVNIKNIKNLEVGNWKLRVNSENRINAAQVDVTINDRGIKTSVPIFQLDVGEYEILRVVGTNVLECKLKTPHGDIISFVPESEYDMKKYQYKPETLFQCKVQINDFQENDSGVWTLSYKSNEESEEITLPIEFQVVKSNPQDKGGDSFDSEESQEHEDDGITWLAEIEHETKEDLSIDITLSNNGHEEECYIINNNGSKLYFKEIEDDGVLVQKTSYFVSCRITIGPMNDNLTGDWTVCGVHTENDDKITRCQLVSIKWKNPAFPHLSWISTIRPLFNHPIHFGGSLSPVVTGDGDLQLCHIVTPNGEDLVILPDSDYPSIKRVVGASSFCSVSIGPFEKSHVGEWLLYGQFSSWQAPFDIRYPMHFSLYNEENPYEQAYNVSNVDMGSRAVNLGNTIKIEVPGSGTLNECFIRTPAGQYINENSFKEHVAFTIYENESAEVCNVYIGPIWENMLGEWQLTGKFNDSGIFTEKIHTLNIIKEDPRNPIQEEGRVEQNLTKQIFNVAYDSNIDVAMPIGTHYSLANTQESCHVRTPDGLQYELMEGFNVTGVLMLEQTGVACGLIISITTEDNIGDWVLISRERSTVVNNEAFERRLPFTIEVEEQVNATPRNIKVVDGGDFHVRLENPTELYDTCKLIDPSNAQRTTYEIDLLNTENCAFIVKNVTELDNGVWEIQYGNKIVYRAKFQVSVIAKLQVTVEDLNWVRDTSIDMYLGPEEAVFCSIQNPQQLTVFVGFGRCHLVVDKVNVNDEGSWLTTVGLPGKILTEEYMFDVHVTRPEPKAKVTTTVEVDTDAKKLYLSCSIASEQPVRICKFRDPSGRVMLASPGAREERDLGQNSLTAVSLQSEVHAHDCGLTITNPLDEDLGIWRCGVETEQHTHYGFLKVQYPWAIASAQETSQKLEPKLMADMDFWTGTVDEGAILSCSIASPIRYCYFRSERDGSILHVQEDTSSDTMEYIGLGFDAGECSIKHKNLSATYGAEMWSCNVGFQDLKKREEKALIRVSMTELVSVWADFKRNKKFSVVATVHGRPIEYCRYVRSDGYAFSTENVPRGYHFDRAYRSSECIIYTRNPQPVDLQPWSVVVKIEGLDSEVWKMTDAIEFLPRPKPTNQTSSNLSFAWLLLSIASTFLVFGVLMSPKKHREWASQRYCSLRSSFKKAPLNVKPTIENVTTTNSAA